MYNFYQHYTNINDKKLDSSSPSVVFLIVNGAVDSVDPLGHNGIAEPFDFLHAPTSVLLPDFLRLKVRLLGLGLGIELAGHRKSCRTVAMEVSSLGTSFSIICILIFRKIFVKLDRSIVVVINP
eukprot:GHVP01034681.1.p1 GENE.GHVP01034681.1~~GHVP01034681.1.p1  ORF type:complete len:124 (-),score=9.47 GHVP01034681.1:945-1316(-)